MLALAGAVLLARRRPALRLPAGALIALVAALDVLRFAHGYQQMIPASSVVPPAPPAVRFLQQRAGDRRIAGLGYDLADDFSSVYGLRDVRGRDVPQPSFRYAYLWAAMGGTREAGEIETVTPLTPKVLGLLGARYLVANPAEHGSMRGLAPVYRGADATIFENALTVPRAFVARRTRAAEGREAEISTIVGGSFDARRDAVVRRADLGREPLAASGAGRVRVAAQDAASVTLHATLARRSLVVLDDAWTPGWSVTVDGRPARALETDVVLRGVVAPPGTHTIRWSYRVPGLRTGAALSGVALLAYCAWGTWLLASARRRRRVARDGHAR